MLESVTNVISRIEEIKSRFRSARVGGEVTIAPHPVGTPGLSSGQVQPFFPNYLLKEVKEGAKGMVQAASAYDGLINASAAKYALDPALLKALIQAESGFNANAVSSAGAKGLTQLMPATAAGLGVDDPLDPQQSIEGGARYLKAQLDRFGDESLALAAYNAGPGAVVKYGGIPPFRQTQGYVNRVLSYRDAYTSR
jgi:soluble lytic murein transglycosylase-like protein